MDIRKIALMPWIHLFASPFCNLKCPYCSQRQVWSSKFKNDFLQDAELLNLFARIPPTHIYLSGGEPLIHPGVKNFVTHVGRHGHVVSIDTNIHQPIKRLEKLLSAWNPAYLGFVNISHHFLCGIPLDKIIERGRLLQQADIPFFVKYVGVPEAFSEIEENMKRLRDIGIGAAVTILQGQWKGRQLPEQYTLEEAIKLLNLVTFYTHGMQIFNGIRSKGLLCRGAQDFIAYNMHDDRKVLPCCHGSHFPVEMENTFFRTGKREQVPCRIKSCLGDLMFICGINGIMDEIDRLSAICHGNFQFLGLESVLEFIHDLQNSGVRLVDQNKLQEIETHTSRKKEGLKKKCGEDKVKNYNKKLATSLQGQKVKKKPHSTINEIEAFISQWRHPDDVIRANPSMRGILMAEHKKLSLFATNTITRILAKKAAQQHFKLPHKVNIEVISSCPLKCGFCTLHDLTKYRREKRMTLDNFLQIWKSMESITTEVEFTGGEPLLNPDVFAMITETKKTGVYSTLTTNAFLLNRKRADKVLQSQPNRILIAYDSVTREHYESTRIGGNFQRLRESVIYLVRRKLELGLALPEINIQMVVNKKNKDEIDSFWDEAMLLGVDSASIKPVFVWPGSGDDFEKKMIKEYLIPDHPMSYHKLDKHGNLVKDRRPGFCPNTNSVHIGSGSEVIPCWYILKDTYIAGYVTDEPFLSIWFSNEYCEYRRRMKEETVHEGCRGCIGLYDPKLFTTRHFKHDTAIQPKTAIVFPKKTFGPIQIKNVTTPSTNSYIDIPFVHVKELHTNLNFPSSIDYLQNSLNKPLEKWNMEVDDAPIFRYIYRNFKPKRHLEFGTWQGMGVTYCLEECNTTVWTLNLFEGEKVAAYSHYPVELPELQSWAKRIGMPHKNNYQTDSFGFVGRYYLEKNFGNRVCQIYCDSRQWDTSNYPDGFFDTVLIDGGHQPDIVVNDTEKALPLLRSGGIMMWHDFCPPIFQKFEPTRGVMEAIYSMWHMLNQEMTKIFWIKPSWILLGIKK